MNRISILDCTLRDGGYINEFKFGANVIKDIMDKLTKASIDIIECGFLESGAYDREKSLFGSIESIKQVIPKKNPQLMYVAMIQYGAISIDEISEIDSGSIDGIRLTFHEHEIEDGFILGEQLKEKGYKVFMQPVGTMTYTDAALLQLIERINILQPYAFYLVDTLGTMYKNDLLRMFYLVDNNLNRKIVLGFHSHNNLQLSFANAQELMQMNTPRQLIIDSSVYGMGRGAGNLNTELVTQYINKNISLRYDNLKILEIIDEYIRPLSISYKWGYDAAYYLASVTGSHPNYASFLLNKQTLYVKDINAILSNLDISKRSLYDEKYIGDAYIKYMSHHVDDHRVLEKLKRLIGEKDVLVLAPGKTLGSNIKAVNQQIIDGSYYVISINFIPAGIPVDMMFISNMKRFKHKDDLIEKGGKDLEIVVTSNIAIKEMGNISVIDYSSYLNEEQIISDNAGLMCINMLKRIGIQNILLVGFDGFSMDKRNNYYDSSMIMDVETEQLIQMNEATERKIRQLRTQMRIEFFADSVYQR